MSSVPAESAATHQSALRVGSVSFLNAKPLIYGLGDDDRIQLSLEVPSRLLDGLVERRLDVALLPVIDYQRLNGLRVLTGGGIGSDGPTLTVRIFSPIPIEQIDALACDTDSHTSVALARIILSEQFGIQPEFIELTRFRPDSPSASRTARLLIGDKVICEEPKDLHHQLDLGQAWKELTGLPFVFAAWMVREGVECGDLNQRLETAKRNGLSHIEQIIERYARPLGWPADIARQYLTRNLQFDIGPRQLRAIGLFHEMAHRHGVIDHAPAPLIVEEG